MRRSILLISACAVLCVLATCASPTRETTLPGTPAPRRGDEIVIAGRLFHTGAPVVLWLDEGGYDAYRTEKRFARPGEAAWSPDSGPRTPNRYSARSTPGDPNSLTDLQHHIDQFVIHYDAAGTSRQCFKILHDLRGLSSHFLLDLDGTIYQTLDLKEKAWHATIANDRSIGIEIANIGAYPLESFATESVPVPDPRHITAPQIERSPLADFYATDKLGPYLTTPAWQADGGLRTTGFVGRPARPRHIVGQVQGQTLVQYDLTPEQYDSLIRLTATLAAVFPELTLDAPRDANGEILTRTLTPAEFTKFRGLLGHFHVQQNKIDPGPAFDWERVVRRARSLR